MVGLIDTWRYEGPRRPFSNFQTVKPTDRVCSSPYGSQCIDLETYRWIPNKKGRTLDRLCWVRFGCCWSIIVNYSFCRCDVGFVAGAPLTINAVSPGGKPNLLRCYYRTRKIIVASARIPLAVLCSHNNTARDVWYSPDSYGIPAQILSISRPPSGGWTVLEFA